jgi:predicted peroxiredoxin
MAEASNKVVVIATHGPENKEMATIPFMMANAALTVDKEAVVILQGSGVLLAQKGVYDHVFAPGLPALGDLLKSFLDGGGKLLVCTPCIQERKIDTSMLIEGSETIAGARVIKETTTSSAVLSY